jgi:hypothetical protein
MGDVVIHVFLTSELVGGEWSASHTCHFTPGRRAPGIHWIGGWLDPRDGLEDTEKLKFLTPPGLELQTLSHPDTQHHTLTHTCTHSIPQGKEYQVEDIRGFVNCVYKRNRWFACVLRVNDSGIKLTILHSSGPLSSILQCITINEKGSYCTTEKQETRICRVNVPILR